MKPTKFILILAMCLSLSACGGVKKTAKCAQGHVLGPVFCPFLATYDGATGGGYWGKKGP